MAKKWWYTKWQATKVWSEQKVSLDLFKEPCHVDILTNKFFLLIFFSAGSFNSDSPVVVAHEQSVYTVEPGKIHVRTFQVLIHEGFVSLFVL